MVSTGLNQIYTAMKDKEVEYKGSAIPLVRIYNKGTRSNHLQIPFGHFSFPTGLTVVIAYPEQTYPKFGLVINGDRYMYNEMMTKEFVFHFVNRVLHPVVLLKTRDEIERFLDTSREWTESTPFYSKKYSGFGEFFSQFRKITRVIAFVSSPQDFADELKQLSAAGRELSTREDLRIAKVVNPKIVRDYKKMHGNSWFSEVSSNSIVMVKKDQHREKIVKFYDLNTETLPLTDWISKNSIEGLEELSGSAFKVISHLKRSIFIAFVNRTHPEYGPESVQFVKILEEIGGQYPGFVFTFTEEDRYRENKKGKATFILNADKP